MFFSRYLSLFGFRVINKMFFFGVGETEVFLEIPHPPGLDKKKQFTSTIKLY